jgi:hypothetical protein
MPSWSIVEPSVSLHLQDTPLFYSPSRGAVIAFSLSYRQRGFANEDPSK